MENRPNLFSYQLEFLNRMERTVVWNAPVSIKIYTADNDQVAVYVETDGTLTELETERYVGYFLLEANTATPVFYQLQYRLTYTDPTKNSDLEALVGQAAAGDVVDLKVNCGYGYEVVGAILTYADGRTETVTGTQFVMPSGAVAVELVVDKIAFRITFVADGVVYQEVQLFFGDTDRKSVV